MIQDILRELQNNLYHSSEDARRNMANKLYPIDNKRTANTGLGLLGAALAGAAAAFFLSPKNGKENQKMVKDKAIELLEKGQEVGDKATQKAKEVASNVKAKANEVADTAANKVAEFKENVADSLESAANKMKAEEADLEKDVRRNFHSK